MGGDHNLPRINAAIHLIDQLCGSLPTGFGIAGIDGDNLRVQEFHERRITDAGELPMRCSCKYLLAPSASGIGRAEQGAGLRGQHCATCS